MGSWLEQLIAAGTPAGRSRKNFGKIGIALALVLKGGLAWFVRFGGRLLGHGLFDDGGGLTPALPLAVTSALGAALLPSLLGGTIALGRTPTPPGTGCLWTRLTAITLQGMRRQEELGTPLQQAHRRIPASKVLPGTVEADKIQWAHGSHRSQRSSPGGKQLLASGALWFRQCAPG